MPNFERFPPIAPVGGVPQFPVRDWWDRARDAGAAFVVLKELRAHTEGGPQPIAQWDAPLATYDAVKGSSLLALATLEGKPRPHLILLAYDGVNETAFDALLDVGEKLACEPTPEPSTEEPPTLR